MDKTNIHLGWLIGIVFLLAFFRFIPHPPNATPIAAMALFAGAFFHNRVLAYIVPTAAMLLSDLVLGIHSTIVYVYAGIMLTVFIGSTIKKVHFFSVGISAIIASAVFFLITNFGAWLHHDMYAQNLDGLLHAYAAGIPFLRNSLIANLIFTYLVFYSLNSFFDIKTAENSN